MSHDALVEVTIVLPAYNEEAAIVRDIGIIQQAMDGAPWPYEILVVDDGSTDRTAELAKGCGARVILHGRNRGEGRARKTGIRHARGEIIVTTDADGTYPNHLIPKLVAALSDCDQVVGARVREAGTYRFLRTLAKESIRRLAQFIAGEPIPDLNSGFRAFRKSTAKRFLHILPDTHSLVSTITLAYMCNDYSVKYIPIPYYPRIGKSSFHPVRDTYRYLLLVIRTMALFRPLKMFFPISLALCLWGLSKFIWDWQIYSDVRESDIMIIVVGVLVGVAGLLADLVVTAQKAQYVPTEAGREQEM